MPTRFFTPVLCSLLCLAPRAAAVDKDKLRQSVNMPSLGVKLGAFQFTSGLGLVAPGEKAPPPRPAAVLSEALKNTPADAEIYAELCRSYTELGKKDLAEEARAKAEKLYRQRLQQQPGDARAHILLANSLDPAQDG